MTQVKGQVNTSLTLQFRINNYDDLINFAISRDIINLKHVNMKKNDYFVTTFSMKIKNIAEKYMFSGIKPFFIQAWN